MTFSCENKQANALPEVIGFIPILGFGMFTQTWKVDTEALLQFMLQIYSYSVAESEPNIYVFVENATKKL
jgi:hypothetical protein